MADPLPGHADGATGTPEAPAGPDAAKGREDLGPAVGESGIVIRHRPLALATLCAVLFITFLDITIVSVALAGIQTQLHAGVSALQWVVGAYALTFASAMLMFGTIGDQFGRKKTMLVGLGVFILGALMAGLSMTISSSSALAIAIAGRAVMGFGAAATEPGTLSMLRHLYPDYRMRNRSIGVWSAVSGVALALGPVVGGALVYVWSWRAIFWFNVIFAIAAVALAAMVLPESADPDPRPIDIAGALLGAAPLATLIFAVINAESAGFSSPDVLGLLCASAASFAAFLWRESRAARPLLDIKFLHIPRFATPVVVAFCAYFATFAIFFFTALFLEEVSGYNGGQIAEGFLPMTILMIAASLRAGRWASIFGLRPPLIPRSAPFPRRSLSSHALLS